MQNDFFPYEVLAYYYFINFPDAEQEVKEHLIFCRQYDIRCRLYISANGINGQMSASKEASRIYQEWLKNRPGFEKIIFKIHYHHEHCFPRLSIKYKKSLVASDEVIDLENSAPHISPKEWRECIEKDSPVILDIRNDYEWDVGHFEGTERPSCNNFREFSSYADTLSKRCDKETTPVLMCCTGGIRCELFSSMLVTRGFKKVYQLDGGIIGYGLKEGSKYWKGKLFVFDDRMTVPISHDTTETVGICKFCNSPTDAYYNCAVTDCNQLFLSCTKCLKSYSGCCSETCQDMPIRRELSEQNPHKPFRRAHEVKKTFTMNSN